MADSWGAAHALARWRARPIFIAPPGDAVALPVAALRLPAGIVAGLRVLGLERIGELAAQPRAPLALRFGPEPGRRLDQALGRLAEPITPVRPAELVEVRRAFAEPIGAAETIARTTAKLAVSLCAALEARGLGARRLDLVFTRVDAGIAAIRVGANRVGHAAMRASPSAFDAVGLGANRVRDEPGSVADEIFGPDPAGHDIDFVANEARPMGMDYAIANGFGFGGVNASALFRRWTDESASRRTGGERDRRSARRLPLPR